MTALLLRLFVKDHTDTASPVVRAAVGKLAGTVGIVCNLLLCIGKILIGYISGSVAIVADAANNLSDVSSSVITLLAFRFSQKPADKDHPYGHARYEYLAGLGIAFLILLIGSQLVVNSIERILSPVSVQFSTLSLVLLGVSALVKLWMSLFFKTLGHRIQSSALHATAVDCRNDVLATSAVLVGCLVFTVFRINVDAYIGLGVAVFILYSGFCVAKETVTPLLGAQADEDLVNRLCTLVSSHEQVLGIHDLLIHDYGPGRCFASVHAELSAAHDPMATHDILDAIEREAMTTLNVHLVIHYDPVDTADARLALLRDTLTAAVQTVDPCLTVHDLRLVNTANGEQLHFDVTVPYAFDRCDEVKRGICTALAAKKLAYDPVISFDEQQ